MASAHTAHATYYLDVAVSSQNQAGNYTTLLVTFYAVCDSGWGGGSYASGIGFSATGYGNGSFTINGASVTIVQYYYNVWHDANGYCSGAVYAHANATGTSAYGGPIDLGQAFTCPRIPKVPQAPGCNVVSVAGRNVVVNVGIPAGYDEGGSSVQYLWVTYSKDGGPWTGGTNGGWGQRTYSNLAPGSYQFRALAHNAIGDGPNSAATAAVRVISGGKRNVPGWGDFTIMRRFSGTAWIDIASARKAVPPANYPTDPMTWPELVGIPPGQPL